MNYYEQEIAKINAKSDAISIQIADYDGKC